MKRYVIVLSYRGTNYCGWQRQPNSITVQQVIEESISKYLHNEQISVLGCGRTDTGVHAKKYYLHVDLPEITDLKQFLYVLNKILPRDIAFHEIREIHDSFHARFDATSRTYRYFIHTRKDAFIFDQSFYIKQPLNFRNMERTAELLIGEKDFTSFAKLHTDVKTHICNVTQSQWHIISESEMYFEITANRFLRNMVRSVVGTLLDVGLEKTSVEDIDKIILAKDRQCAGRSVPAHGLFLWDVVYPNLK